MKTNGFGYTFWSKAWKGILAFSLCGGLAAAGGQAGATKVQQTSTAEDFLRVPVKPVAIGHHGVGPNLGGDSTIPIENTVDSVRQAYSLGARVVEVDVQLTGDGKLAVFHNDFLDDFTCIDSLTMDQLQAQIEVLTGLPVTIMTNKKNSLGLTWAEIGPVYRLPGYSSPVQFLETGLATSVRVVGGEMDFFGPAEQQQPGSGSQFVAGAHSFGFRGFVDAAQTPAGWNFLPVSGGGA